MKKLNNLIQLIRPAALLLMMAAALTAGAQTQAVLRTIDAENRVAILPMIYVAEGNDLKLDEMRYRLQNIAHDYLRSDAMELTFQDPAETNALLRKHNINAANVRDFTPKELATLLHVEYVLMGTVTQDFVAEATVTHTNRRDEDHRHHRHYGRERQTNSHTRTSQELATHIDLDIYNDKGENIYSKSRRSILSGVDAYKYGIQYLLKRSPIYKR